MNRWARLATIHSISMKIARNSSKSEQQQDYEDFLKDNLPTSQLQQSLGCSLFFKLFPFLAMIKMIQISSLHIHRPNLNLKSKLFLSFSLHTKYDL